jgi:uncharacterized protein YggT (Ycf19 family)
MTFDNLRFIVIAAAYWTFVWRFLSWVPSKRWNRHG